MKKLTQAALVAYMTLTGNAVLADPGAILEITIQVVDADRASAAGVYQQYKQVFLDGVDGAEQKLLLIREDDVQVLHGFDTVANANAYLGSALFNDDVVVALKPYMAAAPDVRIYKVN